MDRLGRGEVTRAERICLLIGAVSASATLAIELAKWVTG